MMLWRSLTPTLIVAAAKALAARSAQAMPEAPKVTPLPVREEQRDGPARR